MSVIKREALIIGSGQGGAPLAVALAKRGQRVTLFEKGELGGSCINHGCTPSKALLAAAELAASARRGAAMGVSLTSRVNFPEVLRHVQSQVQAGRDGLSGYFNDAGVEVVHAEARFISDRRVTADGREYEAPLIVIDVGTSARIPDLPGLRASPYLTDETIFDLPRLPQHLAILGGGPIGVELGQAYARLGAKVTILETAPRLLGVYDADAAGIVQAALEADGVRVMGSAKLESVAWNGEAFELNGSFGTMRADRFLVAIGRQPVNAALNLDLAGIKTDEHGYVAVDEHLRTANPRVYAIGEAAGQAALTNVSWEDYLRVLSVLDGQAPRTRNDRVVSQAIFTDPQLAVVGLTETKAREAGLDAVAATQPLERVARARETGRTSGLSRLIVERGSHKLLGAVLVGPQAAEVAQVTLPIIQRGGTLLELTDCVFSHPSWSEGLGTLARQLEEKLAAPVKP